VQSRYLKHLLFSIAVGCATTVAAQPAPLPGKGLAQHPFLYCGEWQNRSTSQQVMYIVRDGKIVWSYTNPLKGELGDCTMLSNGNIVFSRQFGASEITPDKKIVWNYDGPPGTEIHTTYPVGKDRVLIMQNGNPAKLMLIQKATGKVEKELVLQTRDANSVHGQFRHIRMTQAGTFLVAHMDLGKVVEYSADGKEIWSVAAPSAWAAPAPISANIIAEPAASTLVTLRRSSPANTGRVPRIPLRIRDPPSLCLIKVFWGRFCQNVAGSSTPLHPPTPAN